MTTTYHPTTGERPTNLVVRVLKRIDNAVSFLFDAIVRSTRMANEYERMSHMSDRELARHGMSREDIPQYLFKRFVA